MGDKCGPLFEKDEVSTHAQATEITECFKDLEEKDFIAL